MTRKSNRLIKFNMNEGRIKARILGQAKKQGNIVFGARAIQQRLGISARRTKDTDLFSRTPKKSALQLERIADSIHKQNDFFTKKGRNPGTFKVKFAGRDGIPGTMDDIGVADFTRTPRPRPKTFIVDGVNFRTLSQELKAKQKLVRNPKFAFRRQKDLQDLRRIKRFRRLK